MQYPVARAIARTAADGLVHVQLQHSERYLQLERHYCLPPPVVAAEQWTVMQSAVLESAVAEMRQPVSCQHSAQGELLRYVELACLRQPRLSDCAWSGQRSSKGAMWLELDRTALDWQVGCRTVQGGRRWCLVAAWLALALAFCRSRCWRAFPAIRRAAMRWTTATSGLKRSRLAVWRAATLTAHLQREQRRPARAHRRHCRHRAPRRCGEQAPSESTATRDGTQPTLEEQGHSAGSSLCRRWMLHYYHRRT